MRKTFFVFFILFCSILPKVYAISWESTQVSLLTIMPRSNEVYTIYGHTALRIENQLQGLDVVFNYGTFDFDKPHFLYRFIKGETDYFLSVEDYRFFFYHYASNNATVREQILDISAEEKRQIMYMLDDNIEPENREYRYNFIFDNCVTRPRDIIEKYCGGQLIYNQAEEKTTFRKLIHECTAPYPWMTFGIDLIIGNGADSIIGKRNEMFLPVKLMKALDNASVENDSLPQRPIVSSSQIIIRSEDNPESRLNHSWSSPVKLGFIMVILCVVVAVYGWIRKKTFRFFHSVLFLSVGLAGCLVAFVALVSSHPCTWPNWNLLWIHPLHIIPAIGYLFKKTYRFIRWYHWSNFVLLSSLLLGWTWIPQELNIACIPFILCLWIGSGYKLLIDRRLNK